MRIGHAQAGKYHYLDRLSGAGLVAQIDTSDIPHAPTIRIQFTGPANRLIKVDGVFLETRRLTAATTAGLTRFWYEVGVTGNIYIARIAFVDNTVDVFRTLQEQQPQFLPEGSEVRIKSADASTGGTVNYFGSVIIQTFAK